MKVAREDLRGNLFQRSYIVYRRAATQIRRRFWVVHAGTLSTTQKRSRDRLPGLSFFLLARPRIRIIESRSTTPRDLALHLPAKDPHSLPRFHISFTVHCASFRPDGDVFYDSRSGKNVVLIFARSDRRARSRFWNRLLIWNVTMESLETCVETLFIVCNVIFLNGGSRW